MLKYIVFDPKCIWEIGIIIPLHYILAHKIKSTIFIYFKLNLLFFYFVHKTKHLNNLGY